MTTENTHKVPNVPPLRFPEFSGEWEKCTLRDISEISKGSGISKDQLSDKGEPCILYGELYTKYKSEVINYVYSRSNIDATNLVRSKKNDIIIPASGETAIDISTARCVPFDGILLGGDLSIIRLKEQDGRYFSYQLNGIRKLDIAKIAQGVSVVHLYGENLKRLKVAFPAIEEQRKIADFINLLDSRIATQNKILQHLESLIKGLNEKVLWQYKSKVALHEILKERNERTTINNQHPVISSTAKGLFLQSEYFDKEVASADNVGYKVLRKGNIVLSPQNLWLGNINYNDKYEIGIVSPSYKTFTISEEFNPFYVACLLRTYRALYEYACVSEQGASVVRRNLDMEAFMEISFPMPSIDEQNRIAEGLQTIYKKLQVEKALLDKYRVQKQYLLQQMFI